MSVVGYSTLEVIPSVVKLRANIEKQTAGDMAAAGRTAGTKFGDEAGKSGGNSFKSRFSGALKGYAPFAGLAIGAGVTALFKSAIDEASSLAESANKINVVFGDAAGQVNAFADAASEGLGQSDLQARNAAASFGVYGKAAQLAGDDLGEFATSLTGLSSDLASFFDTDIQTAIDAIGSGLRGEAEPLRQFGVLLDDATLRSEALKQGLIKTTKEALTPQQKVLAAYASIMEQTKDAQGDFARTSDGLANSSRDLAADWADMRAEIGARLLPAMLELVSFLKDDALPALSTVGGVARDAVQGFAALPGPVQAAAGAFAALKFAAATGLGTTLAAGVGTTSSAMQSLALRAMFARDAFVQARTASMTVTPAFVAMSRSANVATASFAALRAASAGAGTAMRTGLSNMVGFLGGPWGIAMIAATAAIGHFWQEHQKAEAAVAASDQRVKAFTATLDANTGALTEASRRFTAEEMFGAEVLRQFEEIGIGAGEAVSAVLEGGPALEAFRIRLEDAAAAAGGISPEATIQWGVLALEIERAAKEAEQGQDDFDIFGRAVDDSAEATEGAARVISTYKDQIRDTRTELQKLIAAEQERALAAIQSRRDQLALITTLQAAEKEARKGKATLDQQTEAGQANWQALLDLADQWSNSTPKVQNARGAYEEMRRKFIDVAVEMGATEKRARKLAEELLAVPKDVPLRFRSEGFQERMAELRALKQAAAEIKAVNLDYRLGKAADIGAGNYASGGRIGGVGSGTSDSNLIWASRGEFMQPKASVDYYGEAFMEAVRRRLFPKLPGYAKGGSIQPVAAPMGPTGLTIGHMTVVAQDWRDFARKGQQKATAAMSDGVNWG